MKANTNQQKKIDSMIVQLKSMRKRSEAAMKKIDDQILREEKKYQKELTAFQKMYGA